MPHIDLSNLYGPFMTLVVCAGILAIMFGGSFVQQKFAKNKELDES